ncbi:NAD(P)/FAD-dependent oxidoreductase [Thiomicrorhabdus heinhorstiae]|uniref:NAD(P)/FAD-dependent oxidoreductase n=1 Tax=Thiomicrorhabdus heinhorstiae TaxID=2748010 RepID=A0ABS0BVW2_9GAMM|nr:FAD-dependent oxidoreductase [Thiomicrorhabdus heinhorstiae]MBF6057104.1 NAD(P)/FAD-dependent oxidoreductase [Thiomicrorhabdus heinhorstiae]
MAAGVNKPELIMVGAGMAGTRFLDELLALTDHYRIRVFNREPHGGYNRIMLSPVLAGEKSLAEIMTHDADWFAAQGIELHTDRSIVGIDRQLRQVRDSSGKSYHYDKLIIATGSKPFMLPIENIDLSGVVSFREIGDVHKMQQAADGGTHAVIIGGGLLGLEAAYGLQKQGMDVSVVHRSSVLMNAQMDAEAGGMLQSELATDSAERQGMRFYMQSEVVEIISNENNRHIQSVRLKDGRELSCDLLVMAIGIRPNVELGMQAGLEVNRGIVVNDQLQTSDANIYALGECVEHRGQTYGLVAPLYEQAKVLADVLAEQGAEKEPVYEGSLTSTMLKVTGINLFSAGDFNADGENSETLIFRDPQAGIYRKLVLQNNLIVGVLLYGDTYEANWLFELLQNRADVSTFRDTVLFGSGFTSAA